MNSARYPAYIYPERFNGRVRAFFKLKPASLLRIKRISGLRKKKVVVTSKARINRLLSHRKILDYGTSAFFLYPCTSFLGKVVANPQSCYTFKFIYRQLTRRKQGVAQTLVEERASKLLRIILAQQAKKHAAVPDFDRASLMLGSAIPENIPDAWQQIVEESEISLLQAKIRSERAHRLVRFQRQHSSILAWKRACLAQRVFLAKLRKKNKAMAAKMHIRVHRTKLRTRILLDYVAKKHSLTLVKSRIDLENEEKNKKWLSSLNES